MSRIGYQINVLAKQRNMDPNRLRALFALERLVARLEANPRLSRSLIYKGGFVLVKTIDTNRFTRDLDALAHSISQEDAQELLLKAVQADLNDGISFGDPQATELQTTGDYGGLRIDLCFQLDVRSLEDQKIAKLPRVHLDIGFGPNLPIDIPKVEMTPIVKEAQFKISWAIYPLEFIFAEKLQTMVSRGEANSRAKDFYDMWRLSQLMPDRNAVVDAIRNVFNERKTELPSNLSEFVSKLDTLIIRNAWKSVLFKEIKVDFETAFAGLFNYLEVLK
jgi:hypothetical protein